MSLINAIFLRCNGIVYYFYVCCKVSGIIKKWHFIFLFTIIIIFCFSLVCNINYFPISSNNGYNFCLISFLSHGYLDSGKYLGNASLYLCVIAVLFTFVLLLTYSEWRILSYMDFWSDPIHIVVSKFTDAYFSFSVWFFVNLIFVYIAQGRKEMWNFANIFANISTYFISRKKNPILII